MRRVRNPNNSNCDPLAMFSAGVEHIISGRISKASIFDDQKFRAMQRSPKKQALPISIFAVLARQLFLKKAGRQL